MNSFTKLIYFFINLFGRCLADSNCRKIFPSSVRISRHYSVCDIFVTQISQIMLLRNLNSGLADGVGEEDEDGHEDGEGYEGDAEELL